MLVMVFSPIGLVCIRERKQEKKTDHRMDVLIDTFAPQTTQREQPDTFLLQQTKNVLDLKSVLFNHGKLVCLFIEMPEKCSCHS